MTMPNVPQAKILSIAVFIAIAILAHTHSASAQPSIQLEMHHCDGPSGITSKGTIVATQGVGNTLRKAANDLPNDGRIYYNCPQSNVFLVKIAIQRRNKANENSYTSFHLIPTEAARDAVEYYRKKQKRKTGLWESLGRASGAGHRGGAYVQLILPFTKLIDLYGELRKEFVACRDQHPDGRMNLHLDAYEMAFPGIAERTAFRVRSWTSIYQQLYCHSVGETVTSISGGLAWDLEEHRDHEYFIFVWPLTTCNFGTYFWE